MLGIRLTIAQDLGLSFNAKHVMLPLRTQPKAKQKQKMRKRGTVRHMNMQHQWNRCDCPRKEDVVRQYHKHIKNLDCFCFGTKEMKKKTAPMLQQCLVSHVLHKHDKLP
ncbi:hypothetical protein MRX96_024913 [Rhipicephalus microplus]